MIVIFQFKILNYLWPFLLEVYELIQLRGKKILTINQTFVKKIPRKMENVILN